ncbi:MAG: DUF4968 domain-containing protein, partial [Oscillospiraceae bacterium]|nr:DUF4968 domain-containing protein [Oscillospiraceae bacterium]
MQKKYALDMKPVAKASAVVAGEKYRFTVLTDRLIRVEYQEQGRFVDEPTKTVICRDFPETPYRVIEKEDSLEIITEQVHLYYDKKPFSHDGLCIELKQGFHPYGSAWNYGDKVNDLRGTARTLDEANGAIPLESGLMSRFGFTVLDDSNSAFIAEDQWPAAKNRESIDMYFFGYGHDYLDCLRDFYRLTGATPLLPRFTLGNWWSRYYKYTEESYIKLMDEFRSRKIPFSTAVIDMDWHLVDIPKKYGTGWTGYTWNPDFFPDPKRFMDKLHEYGMKVTLNVHPADGVRAHEEDYLPMAKELGIDYENEDKIPFDAGNRKFLESYFKYLHHPNEAKGVDFWWLDWQQGGRGSAPGIDTLWLLNHLHFLDSGRNGKKPLTFSRYAGLGSHRYPVGFSGDTITTWESLQFQPYFTANASNAGYTWWSHDIGGHMQGYRDDELTTRWVQLGVFSPIMRLHSSVNEFYGKEPWNYNLASEKIMTEYLQLRHKLIPYLYSMNYQTHLNSLPLVRPMYYHHEEDLAYEVPNQFYFGTEMLVCPITEPANADTLHGSFDAWLPEGGWYDFFTGRYYRGGKQIRLNRDLNNIPVFVKAGGIVPMAENFLQSHLGNPEKLNVHVFNGAAGSFDLYEDKGDEAMEPPVVTSFAFTPGTNAQLKISV